MNDITGLPNAYSCEYNKIRGHMREAPITLERAQEDVVRVIGREVVLTRRWVHHPSKGKGAVWCDDQNRTHGPICFLGQSTAEAPEILQEPEGGW